MNIQRRTISVGCKFAGDSIPFEDVGANWNPIRVSTDDGVVVLPVDVVLGCFGSDYKIVCLKRLVNGKFISRQSTKASPSTNPPVRLDVQPMDGESTRKYLNDGIFSKPAF